MKQLKYAFALLFFLTVISCEKEDASISKNEEKLANKDLLEKYYVINQPDVQNQKRQSSIQDELLDVFEGFVDRGVITPDFVFETGFPLWEFIDVRENSDHNMIIIPTAIEETCDITGIWYYYSDANESKINYDRRSDFINDSQNQTSEEYYWNNGNIRAGAFLQSRKFQCDEVDNEAGDVYIETRDDDGSDNSSRPCNGGQWVEIQILVYNPADYNIIDQAIHTLFSDLNELRQNHAHLLPMITIMDGNNYSGLENAIDNYFNNNPDLATDANRQIMAEYLELRGDLANLGIGNEKGKSGIWSEYGRGGDFGWHIRTLLVWVWCWEDPLDFDLSSGNDGSTNNTGGNNPNFKPDWWEDVKELQECISVNETHDIDGHSGGNEDASFTGDVEMCNKWNQYKAECLGDDFDGNFASHYFQPGQVNNNPYYIWAQLKENNPELFDEIISGTECKSTQEIKDILDGIRDDEENEAEEECLRNAIADFEAEYDITLTDEELDLLSGIGCGDNFNDDVWDIICDKGFDYVTSKLSDCPKVDCIYEKLRLLEGNEVCKIIRKLEENNYKILLEADDLENYPGTEASPLAQTVLSSFGIELTVNIQFDNERACEADNPLIIAEALLHEFLHAEFYIELQKLGWDGDQDNIQPYWTQYLENQSFEEGLTTHEAISKYYLFPIASALWELNEKVGTPFDYYGYILSGLYYGEEGVGDINQFMVDYDISIPEAIEAFNISESLVGGKNMKLKFDCE